MNIPLEYILRNFQSSRVIIFEPFHSILFFSPRIAHIYFNTNKKMQICNTSFCISNLLVWFLQFSVYCGLATQCTQSAADTGLHILDLLVPKVQKIQNVKCAARFQTSLTIFCPLWSRRTLSAAGAGRVCGELKTESALCSPTDFVWVSLFVSVSFLLSRQYCCQ